MKRVIAVILVLCMALSLRACSSSGSGSASGEKVIKIGVFEPSSGDSASGGKKEILGMQYANSQEPTVTLGGETYKVELVYGDNGSSTDKAPSAASSLVSAGVSPSASPAPTPTSPRAIATTSVSASWITSRPTFWPTSP